MKRSLVAAFAFLALGVSAHAAPAQCSKQTPDDLAKTLSEKAGKEFGALALPAKQFAAAMTIAKGHADPSKVDQIKGDGASFVAGDGGIFLAFTMKGKVCAVMVVPPKIANAIIAADPAKAEAPDAPPASSHEKHFEHHDTTES